MSRIMTPEDYAKHQAQYGRARAILDAAPLPAPQPGEKNAGKGAKEPPDSVLLPYPVSTNRAWRNFRGQMVMSAEGRAYKAAVAAAMVGQVCFDGAVCFSYWLHPRMTKKGKPSQVRIDLDNMKLLIDALNGVAWRDDSQITELHGYVGEPVIGGGVSVLAKRSR